MLRYVSGFIWIFILLMLALVWVHLLPFLFKYQQFNNF